MKMRPYMPGILLFIAFVLASAFIPRFLDVRYLLETSTLYVEIGLLALGVTLVIVSGNIDLSVGSILVISACICALLLQSGIHIAIAIVATCGMATAIGVFNGLIIAKLRVPSFLVTLATMAIARGVSQAILGPKSIKLPPEFRGIDQQLLAGIPVPLVVLLISAALISIVLTRTVFGRWIFAVGTNERAAVYSAIPVDRVKIYAFAVSGLLAGIAAVLMDSRLAVARSDLARGIELDAITVAVVGGAAIRGGTGSILGTMLALGLVVVIKTAMGVANVKPEYQLLAIGALLIVAVFAERWQASLQNLREWRPAKIQAEVDR